MSNKKLNFSIAVLILLFLSFISLYSLYTIAAVPEGPSAISVLYNQTRNVTSPSMLNNSGGYIYYLSINATQVNSRWKAYVGNITGKLSLNDAAGDTIYDWTLSTSLAGEVYATRNSTTVMWSRIRCANNTILENENYYMNHTSPDDNISKTFSATAHASFLVGLNTISANSCPSTRTYVNNVSASDFDEVVLFDGLNSTLGGNVVYSTIVESDAVGFDSRTYDFQMLLPDSGLAGFTSSTAYYFYVELS